MKTVGLIGGLMWPSTIDYYRLLNQKVNEKLGGVEAAHVIIYSVNFAEIKTLTIAQDWQGIAVIIIDAANKLVAAGATCILIGANTMHKIADEVQEAITVPVIHITMETAKVVAAQQIKKVALLGTKYTMQLSFYKDKLAAQGITTIIPDEPGIEFINNAIYNEMSKDLFLPATKQKFIKIIQQLQQQGAEGVILGCTEIPILIKPQDVTIPVFNTISIHVNAAIEFAFS
ncbi:MAG: amino acid racemase [Chitinophagaceae bacterium]|jgi:aspartate racemase|nr:amino acid racemase [Chitinophagaceae bacterium]